MTKQIINNNQERLVQIALKHHDPDSIVSLLPGMNFIDSEKWKKAKELEYVRDMLIMEIEPSPAPEAQFEKVGHKQLVEMALMDDDKGYAGIHPATAKKVVAELYDLKVLKSWLSREIREDVKQYLEKQIAIMEDKDGLSPMKRMSA